LGYYISSQIFIEILESVDYMHKQNIVHKNLKPYNIFLKKGSYGRIVRITNSYNNFIRQFVDTSILNSEVEPKYIAPEYFDDGFEALGAKADIYSLGVIFQVLLDVNVNRYRAN
jgi:serine/threonine protein kinase